MLAPYRSWLGARETPRRLSTSLYYYLINHLSRHIGQAFIARIVEERELLVVETKEMQNGNFQGLQSIFDVLTYNAVTGTILLVADATTKLANPDFYVKMVFIALALINLRMQRNSLFRVVHADKRPLTTNDKILALTSLFFWLGAITSGRLLAYVGPVSGLETTLR